LKCLDKLLCFPDWSSSLGGSALEKEECTFVAKSKNYSQIYERTHQLQMVAIPTGTGLDVVQCADLTESLKYQQRAQLMFSLNK